MLKQEGPQLLPTKDLYEGTRETWAAFRPEARTTALPRKAISARQDLGTTARSRSGRSCSSWISSLQHLYCTSTSSLLMHVHWTIVHERQLGLGRISRQTRLGKDS